jgi:hypothetical protein
MVGRVYGKNGREWKCMQNFGGGNSWKMSIWMFE